MASPQISVVIPYRSNPRFIFRVLTGLSNQSASSKLFEVIVVDDACPRSLSAAELLVQFPKLNVRFYRLPEHLGAAAARNLAARHACGEVLAFLDDDAVPAKDWIDAIATFFQKNSKCSLVQGSIEKFERRRETLVRRLRQARYDARHDTNENIETTNSIVHFYGFNLDDPALRLCDYVSGGNFSCRRNLFIQHAGFDELFKLTHDKEFAKRVLAAGNPIIYAANIVIYHDHNPGFAYFLKSSFRSGYYGSLCELKMKKTGMKHLVVNSKLSLKDFVGWESLIARLLLILGNVLYGIGEKWARYAALERYGRITARMEN